MRKILTVLLCFFLVTAIITGNTYAQEIASGSSARLYTTRLKRTEDSRVKILTDFLTQYDSPLTQYAAEFIKNANIYDLDWKLVAAISGVESTFGQFIPYNSFNAWGWGVYGNNVIRFSSWQEGIEIVGKGIRENFIDKIGTDNIYAIGRIYAESPTWASKVTYFMQKMSEFETQNLANNLPISL